MNNPMLIVPVIEVDINLLADLVEENTPEAREDFEDSWRLVPPEARLMVDGAIEAELDRRILERNRFTAAGC